VIEPDDRWLSVEENCRHLGVSRDTVYRWIDKSNMPAHRVGRLRKLQKIEINQLVKDSGAADKKINRKPN
jgi:excisionase family DNA binding protein